MAARVRVAVLGVGSLGRQHARIYGEMHRQGAVELVGVYDTASALAKTIAAKPGTAALGSGDAPAAAADALRNNVASKRDMDPTAAADGYPDTYDHAAANDHSTTCPGSGARWVKNGLRL